MKYATIFALLAVYQLKHWLADYVFQTQYMLRKCRPTGWVFPLVAHVWVHWYFTYWIVALYVRVGLHWSETRSIFFGVAMGFLDAGIHFIMDRIKASPSLMGRWKQESSLFWIALGFDQAVHHLTHLGIVWILVTR